MLKKRFDKERPWLTSEGEIMRHFARESLEAIETARLGKIDHVYAYYAVIEQAIKDAHNTMIKFKKWKSKNSVPSMEPLDHP